MSEQRTLDGAEFRRMAPSKAKNPRRTARAHAGAMVGKHGPGPEGKHCRACVHLVGHRPGRNSYLKCELYGISHGEATDWRAKWPACRLFEERKRDGDTKP